MEFKKNLNRIHYLLTEKFGNVFVKENSNTQFGNHLEISVKENFECKLIIKKTDLEKSNVNFIYFTNPVNEKSHFVTRSCDVETFAECIKDIIDNKRFDSEYIESIK